MNKRIKELMLQAGFDPAAIERMGVMPNVEKFTELIVQECADVADLYDNGSSDEWDRCARNISRDIKISFGIKE